MRHSTAVVFYLLPATCFAAISVPFQKTTFKRKDDETAPNQKRTANPETLTVTEMYRENLNGSVGTPGQPISWIIDTGSSDVWMIDPGASTCTTNGCNFGTFDTSKSSTYVLTKQGGLDDEYGTGYGIKGDRFNDTITLPGAVVENCNLGLATDFHDDQGNPAADMFGVGQQFFGLSYASASTPNSVITQMLNQGYIDRPAFSVWAGPSDTTEGELVFGGVDSSKYTGSLTGVGIQKDVNGHYTQLSVAMTDMSLLDDDGNTYALQPSGYEGCSMLLDTGASRALHLPPELLDQIIPALGISDENGIWAVPCGLKQSTAQISFQFGGSDGPIVYMPVSVMVGRKLDTPFVTTDGATVDGCEFSELAFKDASPGSAHEGSLGLGWIHWAYLTFDLQNNVIAVAQSNEEGEASADIQNLDSGSTIPGAAETVQYQVPADVRTKSSYVGTPAVTTVQGTVTGYPCVTPVYDLGVDACKKSDASNTTITTTTTTTTSSISSPTISQMTTFMTTTMTYSATTDTSTTSSPALSTTTAFPYLRPHRPLWESWKKVSTEGNCEIDMLGFSLDCDW